MGAASNLTDFHWPDHAPSPKFSFSCAHPMLPNYKSNAQYFIRIEVTQSNGQVKDQTEKLEQFLRRGLAKFDIISLEIILHKVDEFKLLSIDNIYPRLQYLQVRGQEKRSNKICMTGIENLQHLELLNIENIGQHRFGALFSTTQNTGVKFNQTLSRIQLLNIDLPIVPDWINNCTYLQSILIDGCNVQDISNIGLLPYVKHVIIRRNAISAIHKPILIPNAESLDLSNNYIGNIDRTAFWQNRNLKSLDISDNTITELDNNLFSNLTNLHWLYLRNLDMKELTADHFIPLSKLVHLSLDGCRSVYIQPFAFIGSKKLKILDLRRMNLTAIPGAVTQACDLTNLLLDFNFLHGAQSFPPDIVMQLTELTTMAINDNPIMLNPHSLFLLPRTNTHLMRSLLNGLKLAPFWYSDECARYHWWTHLVNSTGRLHQTIFTSTDQDHLETLTSYADDLTLDHADKYSYEMRLKCLQKYDEIMSRLEPYQTLFSQSHCAQERAERSTTKLSNEDEHSSTIEPLEEMVGAASVLVVSVIINAIILTLFIILTAVYALRKLIDKPDTDNEK